MHRVLVTGATGFVGQALCRLFLNAGWAVRAVIHQRRSQSAWSNLIEWKEGGAVGPDTCWDELLNDVSHVVHLAAIAHRITPESQVEESMYDAVNHLGTARLAEAIAKKGLPIRLVFVSSIAAVTGLDTMVIDESRHPCPETPYGRSKLAAEDAISRILSDTVADWCILRPPLLYGPGNPGNMEKLLGLLRRPLPLPLGNIRNRRSFLYVENLADAIRVAATHPGASRHRFFVTDDECVSTTQLVRKLSRLTRSRSWIFPFPRVGLNAVGAFGSFVHRITGRSIGFDRDAVEKLCGSLEVDSRLFRDTCGWRPPYSLNDALTESFMIEQVRAKS